MGANSKIEWTEHTLEECASTIGLPEIANAVRLEVPSLMAIVAKRNPIRHLETKLRKVGEWLHMVGAEIAASIIAAFLARENVSRKDGKAPGFVFHGSPIASIALAVSVGISVVGFSAGRSCSCDCRDTRPRVGSVPLSCPITSSSSRSLAHLSARLNDHCRSFSHASILMNQQRD